MEEGRNVWLFPDGELPKIDANSAYEAHEAIIILNTSEKKANINIDVFFTDKEPISGIEIEVEPRRVKCIRMDKPEQIGGVVIPRHVQYGLRFESDVKVAVTFGRLETSSEKLAYYVANSFSY